jgi:hypothetical protein
MCKINHSNHSQTCRSGWGPTGPLGLPRQRRSPLSLFPSPHSPPPPPGGKQPHRCRPRRVPLPESGFRRNSEISGSETRVPESPFSCTASSIQMRALERRRSKPANQPRPREISHDALGPSRGRSSTLSAGRGRLCRSRARMPSDAPNRRRHDAEWGASRSGRRCS